MDSERAGVLPDFEKRWRERFSDFASRNEGDAAIAGWTDTGLAARVRYFLRFWPGDSEGATWLDAGCGAGTYSRLLAAQQLDVVGLDYSVPTITKARARADAAIAWGVADATRLPIRSASFDGAMCFGVTQALASSDRLISELARIVRPGGQVWVDGLNAWCAPHWWERTSRRLRGRPFHVRYEFPALVKRLMADSGLVDVRVYWMPILPASIHRCQWLLETRPVSLLLHRVPLLGAVLSHSFMVSGRKPQEQ